VVLGRQRRPHLLVSLRCTPHPHKNI
jgi:hypothetical protein